MLPSTTPRSCSPPSWSRNTCSAGSRSPPRASASMLSRPALFLLACAAATAAFAQPPSPALDEGADRSARLVANARREGSLSLYASMAEKDLIRLVSEFERRYAIKVRVWRSGKNNVLRRPVNQAHARRLEVDVVHKPSPG